MQIKIIGAGIVGTTIARICAEKGNKVEIIERRDHIAGNVYDYVDEYGIRVQKYGPHIFHTNNEQVYEFINKFSNWDKFNLVCGAMIDGICTPTAFNLKTIDQFYSKEDASALKAHIKKMYGDRESATVIELLECEDDVIRKYAEFLFEKDYSLYTAKQWGIDPSQIDKSVLKRVPIRFTYEEAYFKDKYECMPANGFTEFIKEMINHDNISVKLNDDALKYIMIEDDILYWDNDKDVLVIYTGPLDEFFHYKFGKLPYRSLRFEWKHDEAESIQDMPVVAYPQAPDFTRITEYNKLPKQQSKGSTYAVEYPLLYKTEEIMEPYYPVPTEESQIAYEQYKSISQNIKNLIIGGRLADFKYYNMDQAIERAFEMIRILDERVIADN